MKNTSHYNLQTHKFQSICRELSSVQMILLSACNSVIAYRHFAELVLQRYHNHHLIFTNGSVQNGSSGCGIYSSIDNSAIRLPDHTSIFTAEAMVIAADEGLRRDKTQRNFYRHCNIPNSHQITLCWIPSHTNGLQRRMLDVKYRIN